jgi:hypothetical protein
MMASSILAIMATAVNDRKYDIKTLAIYSPSIIAWSPLFQSTANPVTFYARELAKGSNIWLNLFSLIQHCTLSNRLSVGSSQLSLPSGEWGTW